jgi:hypothetical protein
VNTRFSFYSASQNYNGLDNIRQDIVQNFKDAFTFLGSHEPDEYLTDVVRESALGYGAFGYIYNGKWKEKRVAVKKFTPVTPPGTLDPQ